MSNQTDLISTDSPRKPKDRECPEEGRLLYAFECIPVFWYMLFDEASIVRAEPPDGAEAITDYPALSKPTAEALALARARWPHVRTVLGAETDDLFSRWTSFVEENAAAYLHCETWEWFGGFETARALERELKTCLGAFDHIPRRRGGSPSLNMWWRSLLEQCQGLDEEENVKPLGDFTYCGFASSKQVPWGEDY
jgi:hypothetical protein